MHAKESTSALMGCEVGDVSKHTRRKYGRPGSREGNKYRLDLEFRRKPP
jgi:hypothetical protein